MTINNSHMEQHTTSTVSFGVCASGKDALLVRLTNSNGMEVVLSNFGAMIQQLLIPSKNGEKVDVVLGYDSIADYEQTFKDDWTPYHGAVVGRHAGRIANGQFTLNSIPYQIEQNLGKHHIHGASNGLSNVLWNIVEQTDATVVFTTVNPALALSMPGILQVEVRYTLNDNNELHVEMGAVSDADTICNLTQHTYFNLNGHEHSVDGLEIKIAAQRRVLVNEELIPTGELGLVRGSDFDFQTWKACPKAIDDTFVLDNGTEVAAECRSNATGIGLAIYTNQPTLHVYVGGGIPSSPSGKNNVPYHLTSGVCFEAQGFVDAPNQTSFPSTVLKSGEKYEWKSRFCFHF